MALVLNGDGNITGLTAGGLPDATITQADLAAGVAGNGPAFSAWKYANQTLTNATWTKVILAQENFDTASCFDNSTNYRFTPNVAGYYQINFAVYAGSGQNIAVQGAIYKNGSEWARVNNYATGSYLDDWGVYGSVLLYLNGTSDYIELYAWTNGTSTLDGASTSSVPYYVSRMEGFLARAA